MSEIRMWCVKSPEGTLITWAMDHTRREAIDHWLGNQWTSTEWPNWRKQGYRCVRVTVKEAES